MARMQILYVDDERPNLFNFTQLFESEYEVFTARSGEEGLAFLESQGEVALVVSDQRMPGMSGVELLARLRELYPDTVRMMITGYTDEEDLIGSINRGHVYRYIVKPWNEYDLRVTVRNAVQEYSLIKDRKKFIATIGEKNRELERLNGELEERVLARTEELVTTNDMLGAKLSELEAAMAKVRVLQGLLPICAYCKRIRDDRDYWQEVEGFLSKHSEATFSHGICPQCYEEKAKPQLVAALKRTSS